MQTKIEPTFRIDLWIAGEVAVARQACREYCTDVGLCVTLQEADFIYTGGLETGVRVGLVNYPRFPSTRNDLRAHGRALAVLLLDRLCQTSALMVDDENIEWLSRRDAMPALKPA